MKYIKLKLNEKMEIISYLQSKNLPNRFNKGWPEVLSLEELKILN